MTLYFDEARQVTAPVRCHQLVFGQVYWNVALGGSLLSMIALSVIWMKRAFELVLPFYHKPFNSLSTYIYTTYKK